MPTTIHLHAALLAAVDRRARDLGLTRNRFIAQSLEQSLESDTRWSPALVEELRRAGADPGERQALARVQRTIASAGEGGSRSG